MSDDGRFYDLPSRDQAPLFAPTLRQQVEGETDLLGLDVALAKLDLRQIEAQYPRVGAPGYPPRVLLGVLIYGYSRGLRSSRQLDEACRFDVRFRFLTHGLAPDFRTLCRFRREQASRLGDLFRQTVELCTQVGLVLLQQVAVDGTKVQANRSRSALAAAEQAFAQVLAQAEAADGEVPEGTRAAAKEECALMKVVGEGIKPAYNAQVAVDGAHQVIVAQELTRAPQDRGQLAPLLAQVEANCGAAPEAVLADGGYLDQEDLRTVEEQGTTPYLPVREQGVGRLEWVEAEQAFRCPQGHFLRRYRSRAGREIYRTDRCRGCLQAKGCGVKGDSKEVHVATAPKGTGGGALSRLANRMARGGKEIYAARSKTVEPIFAFFKYNWGFRRFRLRGKTGAGSEWSLLCIAHNLGRWIRAWAGKLAPAGGPGAAVLPSVGLVSSLLWSLFCARLAFRGWGRSRTLARGASALGLNHI